MPSEGMGRDGDHQWRLAIARCFVLRSAVAALAVLAGTLGCPDGNPTGSGEVSVATELPDGVNVSESVVFPAMALSPSGGQGQGASAADGLVYESASPGTFPEGVSARITNLRLGDALRVAIQEGGFDPVPVRGSTGDEIETIVTNADGFQTALRVPVPDRRRPRVVRTRPSKGATDVPLNRSLLIVFSEPTDSTSISDQSVAVLVDGSTVDGALIVDPDGLRAEWVPAAPLAAQTTYVLAISNVTDLVGDTLEEAITVPFTTQAPVASVTLSPSNVVLTVGQSVTVLATLNDAEGNVLVGRSVTWTSSDSAVARVNSFGNVMGIGLGSATVTAESEGESGAASVLVDVAVHFAQVSTYDLHTCGIEPDGTAYCWGHPSDGQLGIGTSLPAADQLVPAPVQGGHRFAMVSTGSLHTCGVRTDGVPFCWGWNFLGTLGDGDQSGDSKFVPVRVNGTFTLDALSAGSYHTCGAARDGQSYCWGYNDLGALGSGGGSGPDGGHSPVRVSSSVTFTELDAGGGHTCALTAAGDAYCWGWNRFGQLGNGIKGPGAMNTVPEPITGGGLTFASLSVGGNHTCGLTNDGSAYCWGWDGEGQLGLDGGAPETCQNAEGVSASCTSVPLPVSGGIRFAQVAAGGTYSCGISRDGITYCWGLNDRGQLGTGSTAGASKPEPVAGQFDFVSISAGFRSTCAVTRDNVAYCWGANGHGQLGDGTLTDRPLPTPVTLRR